MRDTNIVQNIGRAVGRLAGIGVLVAGCLATAQPAWSFDTGPHFSLTRDALSAEGFGNTAIEVTQINNWFVDMYEKAPNTPYSGHSDWKTLLAATLGNPFDLLEIEFWP